MDAMKGKIAIFFNDLRGRMVFCAPGMELASTNLAQGHEPGGNTSWLARPRQTKHAMDFSAAVPGGGARIGVQKPPWEPFKPPKNGNHRGRNHILELSRLKRVNGVGNKAFNLLQLESRQLPIPRTLVCPWEAQLTFQREGEDFLERLRAELRACIDAEKRYAVRSSADVEDGKEHSFAGMFKTCLDVQGVDAIVQAILEVWESAGAPSVQAYLEQIGADERQARMGVIIQEMVPAVISGVAFSKNPMTSLDEVVVEAVHGSGTLLVQDGITPGRWVNKWGKWIVEPVEDQYPQDLLELVVSETRRISRVFKKDVDLEWVCDGSMLYWVQMRDITAMGQGNIYSNKMAKEMTPGVVKPLHWSVVLPGIAAVWIEMIAQVTGRKDIDPRSLARLFYYRAYHNLGIFGEIFDELGMPRESLEIMMGVSHPGAGKPPFKPRARMLKLLPRIGHFLWDKWRFANQAETDFPVLEAEARQFPLQPASDLNEGDLLQVIDRIGVLNDRVSYNTLLSILMMQAYSRMLGSQLSKLGVDFQEFDLTEGLEEAKEFHLGLKLSALNRQYQALTTEQQRAVRELSYQQVMQLAGIETFQAGVRAFLEQFGHMSDRTSLFDTVPWRETPEAILQLITNYERDEGANHKVRFKDLKPTGMQTPMVRLFYQKSRQFHLLRDKYSSLFTYTLMLFRAYYLEIADRMVAKGALMDREDVYYLYDEEVRTFAAGGTSGEEIRTRVASRKEEIAGCQDALLPEVIYGESPPVINLKASGRLLGTPTSRGYYTGRTRLVQGLADFDKLQLGDVLVIPHSDVGWVPLFAKAGAVISESGGILSHSSIIAREYGIPAVVSVSGALQLKDNMMVSIDGYKGEIIVHAEEPSSVEEGNQNGGA